MSNLQRRFTQFSIDSIAFCRKLPKDNVTRPLISQYIRSSTSIGANYMEAQNAISRKDFRAKVFICKKEAQESRYWLALLKTSPGVDAQLWGKLNTEAAEITKIIQAITNKLAIANPVT